MKNVVSSQNGYYASPVPLTAGQSQLIVSQVNYQCMNFVVLREAKKGKHKVVVVKIQIL